MKKINKKKVFIAIIILIIITIITSVFGRYIYNNLREQYLISQRFNFTSNLLTTEKSTYKYSNWSGVEPYELPIELYSYENELSLFTYEGQGLIYTLECKVDDETKATCHIASESGEASVTDYIPNENNKKNISIFIVPETGASLEIGDKIVVTLEAYTTQPFKKTISAEFEIEVSEQNLSYQVTDEVGSMYSTLKLLNTKSTSTQMTLTFNPEEVTIDESNKKFLNKTNYTTNDSQYINSVTFNMEPEEVTEIKFYKKDISKDYTYPGGTYGELIVNITQGQSE